MEGGGIQGQIQYHKIAFLQQHIQGISLLCGKLPAVIKADDGGIVVCNDVHSKSMKAAGKLLAVVTHADDTGSTTIETLPAVHALHAPLTVLLGFQHLPCVVAGKQHEVDAVFRQYWGASACGTGYGNAPGKDLRPGGTVQAGVVAVDPFEGVFAQQTGIHIAHKDCRIRVLYFFGKTFFVKEIHIDKLRIREHPAKLVHILFVVPHGGDNLFDFRHFFSSS